MAFPQKGFTYQPLQSPTDFRLLQLLPGEADSPLQCTIYHSTLASPPPYSAVSYTWGTPTPSQPIHLNNIPHPIQPNLSAFLHQLRQRDSPRTLWVDALCINQSDIPEKNIQVPLMGEIYSHAQSVLVWLGPHADDSAAYFSYCQQIASTPRSAISSWRTREKSTALTVDSCAAAVAALQRRAYWTRTWIIQEIVLAADIQIFCGAHSISWPDFILRMPDYDIGDGEFEIGMRNPRHPLGRLSKLRLIATRLTLRQLLFQCHMSQCSEKRDLVYGLLSLAKDRENVERIPVEYGCEVELLFLHTMIACELLEFDGISCAQLCDTLATRLSVHLDRALEIAKEIVRSTVPSGLADSLRKQSFFIKLQRFGRIVADAPVADPSSPPSTSCRSTPHHSPTQLTRATVRETPSKAIHYLHTHGTPEPNDTIYLINFESPTTPSYHVACICRPVHHNADEYGIIPYRVIGLGIIPNTSPSNSEPADYDQLPNLQVVHSLLYRDLQTLCGRVITDGIPGYGLEVTLPELIALSMAARTLGAFKEWQIEDSTVEGHFNWA